MSRMHRAGIVLFGVLLLGAAGCATKGRVSLLDIDTREPAQIEAARFEAGVPYNQSDVIVEGEPAVVAQGIPPTLWSKLMEVVAVLKARVRVLSVEWDDRGD